MGHLYLKEDGVRGKHIIAASTTPTVELHIFFKKRKGKTAGNFLLSCTIGTAYLKPKMTRSSFKKLKRKTVSVLKNS